jgi:hypothetical protein
MRPCLVVLALALLAGPAHSQEAPVNPLAPRPADPWSGRWSDDRLTAQLERRAEGWAGTLTLGGQTFPLGATGVEARLDGTFEAGGARYAFTLTRDGEGATLTTDGAAYRLKRQGPKNPLAGGGPQGGAGPAAPAGPVSVPDDWQRWRHPLGNEVRYPPSWTLQETQIGLLFVPPDIARDPATGQTMEVILLQGVPAQGVTKPDDPKAVQYVEAGMAQLFPFMRRAGQPAVRDIGGRQVAELNYSGTNPGGKKLEAVALVAIVEGQAAIGLLVAEPARFAERQAVVRQIFASCGIGAATRDGRVVGTWRYTSTYSSKDFSTTNVTNLTLAADGRCARDGQLAASATHRQDGDVTGHSSLDSGGGINGQQGTWAADGKKLALRWNDGSYQEYGYTLSDGSAMLLDGKLYERVQ